MRKFVQGFVLIVGFGAAVAAAETKHSRPLVADCLRTAASDVPKICN